MLQIEQERIESYGWKWEYSPTDQWQSYYADYTIIDGHNIMLKPFYLLYSGYTDTGFLRAAGAGGFIWSSTANSADTAYNLTFVSNGIFPSYSNYRYLGFSIRCLAR